ncbi:PIG-L family deacetylase [Ochrobactrum sp. A-1]|uniref:PIG-L family deacetylase n=1 Tax=Ochrobactrum sp. A-1 TaxID=2920940 RepID=UPI001F0B4793|nr:PIG-L family deacetylase [Ochrobactrum sp. A-1]
MASRLYVSPHLDDAALSCGGRISRDIANGDDVLVLNIFTADPPEEGLSPLAEHYHKEWSNGAASYQVRRQEEVAAMGALRCQYINAGLLDAIYRRGDGGEFYMSNLELFAKSTPEWDGNVKELIRKALQRMFQSRHWTTVYAPLGVGGNVDHIQVRDALVSLRNDIPNTDIMLYEEIPYAMESYPWPEYDSTKEALKRFPRAGEPDVASISFDYKGPAIGAYTSQLEGLFGSMGTAIEKVEAYATKLGNGSPAERAFHVTKN